MESETYDPHITEVIQINRFCLISNRGVEFYLTKELMLKHTRMIILVLD